MRNIFIVIFFTLLVSCGDKSKTSWPNSRETLSAEVWICHGASSKSFHSTYKCKGMKACRSEKNQISVERAYSMGRKPCSYCCDKTIFKDPNDPDIYDPLNPEDSEKY